MNRNLLPKLALRTIDLLAALEDASRAGVRMTDEQVELLIAAARIPTPAKRKNVQAWPIDPPVYHTPLYAEERHMESLGDGNFRVTPTRRYG